MAVENRTDLKARVVSGSDIVQSQFDSIIDSAYNVVDNVPVNATGTTIALDNIFGTWYGTPSSPVTDTSFTVGDIAVGGWAGIYQQAATASFTGVTDDHSEHNVTALNLYMLFSPDGTAVSMTSPYSGAIDETPTATNLSISGTETVGNTLTFSYTFVSPVANSEGKSTYKWYRADDASGTNEAAIAGATSLTYVLQAADETKFLRASVIPKDNDSPVNTGVETYSSYTNAIASASGFVPSDLTNLLWWYDFTDVDSITINTTSYGGTEAVESIDSQIVSGPALSNVITSQYPYYLAASAGTGTHRAYGSNPAFTQEVRAKDTDLDLSAGSSFTIVWGGLVTNALREEYLLAKGATETTCQWRLKHEINGNIRLYVDGNNLAVNESFNWDAGENLSIIWTFDGTTHKIYRNGVDASVTTLRNDAVPADTEDLWIGCAGQQHSIDGEEGVCFMYSDVKSGSEISDIADYVADLLTIPS